MVSYFYSERFISETSERWSRCLKTISISFRSDKERAALAAELEDVHGQLETSKKQKQGADKNNRGLEEQLNELRGKVNDLESSLADSESRCNKSAADNAALNVQLEEVEHKLGLTSKNLKTMEANFNDAKSSAESESKVGVCFYSKANLFHLGY